MEADYTQAPFCSVFDLLLAYQGIKDIPFALVSSEEPGKPF